MKVGLIILVSLMAHHTPTQMSCNGNSLFWDFLLTVSFMFIIYVATGVKACFICKIS